MPMDFDAQFRSRKNLLNLPNCLSLFRIALIPLVAVFLAYDTDQPLFKFDFTFRYSPGRMAALIVAIAGITDLLDGYYARKWGIVSVLGKFLDPVADKLFLMVVLIMLLQLDRVEEWLVLALLSREIFITGLRSVAVGEGIIIDADRFGKIKLVFQLVGIGLLSWYGPVFGLNAFEIGTWILYAALVISLVSGVRYCISFVHALQEKRL